MISLTDDTEGTISLDPGEGDLPLTDISAQKRADRYNYALGDKSPGRENLLKDLYAGNEKLIREKAASDEAADWDAQRNQIIYEIARKNGGAVTPEALEILRSMTKLDFKNDPKTIFEKKFADRFMNDAVTSGRPGVFKRAMQEQPEETVERTSVISELAARKQVFKKLAEEAKEDGKRQGWGGFASDVFDQVLPLFSWINFLGKKSPVKDFMGNTIEKRIEKLMLLPVDQVEKEAREMYEDLKKNNLLDAVYFAERLSTYSNADRFVDNATNVLDLVGVGGVARSMFKPKAMIHHDPEVFGLPSLNELRQTPKKGEQSVAEAGKPTIDLPDYKSPTQDKRDADVRRDVAEKLKLEINASKDFLDLREPDLPDMKFKRASDEAELRKGGDLPDPALRERDMIPHMRGDIVRGTTEELPSAPRSDLRLSSVDEVPVQPPTPSNLKITSIDEEVDQAFRDTLRASSMDNPADALTTMGNVEAASMFMTSKKMRIINENEPGLAKLENNLLSSGNPQNFFGNGSALANRRHWHLWDRAMYRYEQMLAATADLLRGSRLPDNARIVALQEAQDALVNDNYVRAGDGIIDMVYRPAELHPSNIDSLVLRIGKPGTGDLFEKKIEAHNWARDHYNLGEKEYNVYQQGNNFYIGVSRNTNERSDKVLEAIADPQNASRQDWAVSHGLGKIRSAADLFNAEMRSSRHIATHVPQTYRRVIRELSTMITSLPKRQQKELEAVIQHAQNVPNPALGINGKGVWYETLADFETAFSLKHGKTPTEAQGEAYHTYRLLNDSRYLANNLAMYRDKAVVGIEEWTFRGYNKDGDWVEVPWFDGVKKDSLPWGSKQEFSIYVYNTEKRTADVGMSKSFDKKQVDDLIKNHGYTVIQVPIPTKRPLAELGLAGTDGIVNYIVTNSGKKRPLSWNQVPYHPGGPVVPAYDFSIKQPVVQIGRGGMQFYYGDEILLSVSSEAQAKKLGKQMNDARILLLNNDPRLERFLAESSLPYNKEQFEELFETRFSKTRPFSYTSNGADVFQNETSLTKLYPDAIHVPKSEHSLGHAIDRSFLDDMDRSISGLKEGSKQLIPAPVLDPFTAMQQGLNQGVKALWLNDYKARATRQFIEEFSDLMDVPIETLRHFPSYFLYNPSWKAIPPTATEAYTRLGVAKAQQQSIISFLGTRSDLGDYITVTQNRIMNSVYNNLGEKATNYLADHHLPFIKDPVAFWRGVAFHSYLGLFNPVQLLLQAQTLTHVNAVAGIRYGIPGTFAGVITRAIMHNPKMLDSAAQMSRLFGWKPDDFKEMFEAFRRTGLHEVASESAMRHDLYDRKLFQSTVGNFLDKGAMFFNEGERIVRHAAFATAYKEWRAANKIAKLDDLTIAKIMDRTDTLSLNMTQASMASWQKGVLSVPTQFTTFNIRLAEQMLGKRLTKTEKMRVYATYAFMYGIPVGFGIGGIGGAVMSSVSEVSSLVRGDPGASVSGAVMKAAAGAVGMWPHYDDIKTEAEKRGIPINQIFWKTLAEGVPHMLLSLATGRDYAFVKRFSPDGHPAIKEILSGDESFKDALGGASTGLFGEIIQSGSPLFRKMANTFLGNDDGSQLTAADVSRFLRSSSSTMNIAAKVWGAMEYGRLYSKRGTDITSMDSMDGLFSALGLEPMRAADIYRTMSSLREWKAAQKEFEAEAMREWRLGVQAAQQNDEAKRDVHWNNARNAMTLGKFSYSDRRRVFRQAADDAKPLDQRIEIQLLRRGPEPLLQNRYPDLFKKDE